MAVDFIPELLPSTVGIAQRVVFQTCWIRESNKNGKTKPAIFSTLQFLFAFQQVWNTTQEGSQGKAPQLVLYSYLWQVWKQIAVCFLRTLFKPALIGKPVVVLSNNDGCVIARSQEVKDLGIKMGMPVFRIYDLIKRHNIQVYSSNYTLYGDLSGRVMSTLAQFAPDVEIYSIDEAFIDLSEFRYRDLTEYGSEIRDRVMQWVGIPVSVGIATTKTLAKLANRIAKQSNSDVFDPRKSFWC